MTHAKIPEPVKTGKPFYLKTEIPKNRRAVKPNDAEG
ncbi:macrolide ABC transporter ATP-binding protein, partial [Bifidobacterium bifidum]